MTFIPEDNKQEKEEETSPPEPKKTAPVKKEKKQGSPLNSIIFLIVIGIALYYGRDYLSGDKNIPGLSEVVSTSGTKKGADPRGEIKVPRISDTDLKKLIAEFKEGYEEMVSPETLLTTEPEIIMIKYSEDKSRLLIELESTHPESGKRSSQDIVYNKDDFGRLINAEEYATIKLHPEE